jgi:uncharacterized protein
LAQFIEMKNVSSVVEDEMILEVPYVPRHEICPEPLGEVGTEAQAADPTAEMQRPSPFAVLGQLKIKSQ